MPARYLIHLGIGLLAVGLCAQARAGATTFSYAGFADTTGLTMSSGVSTPTSVQDPTLSPGNGTVLQLTTHAPPNSTNVGASYRTTAISLGTNDTFSTTFQFRLTNTGGIDPADGFTFILADSTAGLGVSGGGLGYQGVGNSVAVEFDTYDNGTDDGDSSNHVAIDINGHIDDGSSDSDQALSNVYGNPSCGFAGGAPVQNPNTAAGCMTNGDLWTTTISYDGTDLSVTMNDPAESGATTVINDYPIDLSSIVGTSAYVGFTAATASGYENTSVVNWAFTNTTPSPPDVPTKTDTALPEPGTLMILGAGMAALGAARCRRRR